MIIWHHVALRWMLVQRCTCIQRALVSTACKTLEEKQEAVGLTSSYVCIFYSSVSAESKGVPEVSS